MPLRALPPQGSASANFATWAVEPGSTGQGVNSTRGSGGGRALNKVFVVVGRAGLG